MNKLLLDSTIDIYSQYNNNSNNNTTNNNNNDNNNNNNIKIEETNNVMYSDPSFYTNQTNFQLPNSPDSFASNKNSISLSPSTALCSMEPPMLLASSSTTTTSSTITDHSTVSSDFINDIIKSNDHHHHSMTSLSFSDFYSSSTTSTSPTIEKPENSGEPQRKKQRTSSHFIPSNLTSLPISLNHPIKNESSSSSLNQSPTVSSIPTPTTPTNTKINNDDSSNISVSTNSSNNTTNNNNNKKSSNNNNNDLIINSSNSINNSELRRQIHIQSEQKRRAQIKCGFEELRNELPTCLNKKMSKVALLHRTVQHIQHLKSSQMTILAELERLVQENEQLKLFQQSIIQKQAMNNMYSMQ